MLGVGEFCCCLISRVWVGGRWDLALHCMFCSFAEFGFFRGVRVTLFLCRIASFTVGYSAISITHTSGVDICTNCNYLIWELE